MDRLSRSLLRVIARMPPGKLIAVHGAPGSGKTEFLRRTAWLVTNERGHEAISGISPRVIWFRPWSWSKQGNVLAGLVAAVGRGGTNPEANMDRSRELVAQLNRMRFDGTQPDGGGVALLSGRSDPVSSVALGFAQLVDAVKAGRTGRMLLVVDEMDRISPALRWQLIDGLRIMLSAGADITALLCLGRQSALAAVRYKEGPAPDHLVQHELNEVFDMAITVPNLEVRRISSLLRRYLGNGERSLRQAFGDDSVTTFSAAVAHRPLGSPRLLERLANRAVLLAEYAREVRATRELTESQWAWVIISERWPDFRRFMIRGGRERWVDLKRTVGRMSRRGEAPVESDISRWLGGDLILADYLRLHAEGFERDAESIFWLESLLLAAGL